MVEAGERKEIVLHPLVQVAVVSAGMVLFALFVRKGLPWNLISGSGLLMTAAVVAYSFHSERSPAEALGLFRTSHKGILYLFLGCSIGAVFGVLFRVFQNMGTLPSGLGRFVVVATTIGAAEEFLFRGFLQGRLQNLGFIAAVFFATAAHTIYKAALFALPPEGVVIDCGFLAFWTFMGGLTFGILRQLSRNVLPPVAGHVLFDVLVYGDYSRAPWWVWS